MRRAARQPARPGALAGASSSTIRRMMTRRTITGRGPGAAAALAPGSDRRVGAGPHLQREVDQNEAEQAACDRGHQGGARRSVIVVIPAVTRVVVVEVVAAAMAGVVVEVVNSPPPWPGE